MMNNEENEIKSPRVEATTDHSYKHYLVQHVSQILNTVSVRVDY